MNRFKNFFNAEARVVKSFRVYSYIYLNISKVVGYILYNRAKIKYSCDIAPTAKIGKNFIIAHIGGIVIGRNVVIGDDCTINNNVTLGMKNKDSYAMPHLGNSIYISTGAKLLGNISIGDHSIIGANSVVIKSFPEKSIIVGVPARKIHSEHST